MLATAYYKTGQFGQSSGNAGLPEKTGAKDSKALYFW